MNAPNLADEQRRARHAAILAAKPDARFLVQLITGTGARNMSAKNKTAPLEGAAAYSLMMGSDRAARSSFRADTLDHAA